MNGKEHMLSERKDFLIPPAVQPQNRFLETDNRDWHTRAPIPSPSKERSREDQREPRDAHTGSNQWSGPAPSLVKAEVPWSARRGTLSEKDQVLKTVKGILNKMTPEKYDLLKDTALLTNTHYSCKSVVSRTGPRILQSIGSSSFRSLSCHRFPPSLCLGGSEVDEPQSRLMNGSYSRSGLGFSRSPSQVEGKRSWFSALNHCLTPGGSAC